MLNASHPSTIVVPLSTNVRPELVRLRVHFKKGEAGLSADCDALIDQPRAIDNRRILRALGAAPTRRLSDVENALSLLLDLPGA